MLIEFDAAHLERSVIPAAWQGRLRQIAGGLEALGDNTGLLELYVFHTDQQAIVATDLGEMLTLLANTGRPIRIDPFGISSLLHHAHVPMPHTVFQDISFLAMGDAAAITLSGGEIAVSFTNNYPYLNRLSREDQQPDSTRLLELLTTATAKQVTAGSNDGLLMLSSGKDSVSVALALAEAGLRHIPCVTYRAGPDDPEPEIAAAMCKRLGLDHEVVDLPRPGPRLQDSLTAFFRSSPIPSGHSSQIPYTTILGETPHRSGVVLDGGGNDSYMGFLPSRAQSAKQRFRIRGRHLASLASSSVHPDSPINYLARSRAEATLPGRTLRFQETSRFYDAAVDTRRWWYDRSEELRHLDLVDLGNVTISHHIGSSAAMQKMRLAARTIGLGVSMPFCDQPTIDYFFHLPRSSRFDMKTGENKILLREMLLRYLDYDAAAIGKHYFAFDGTRFIQQNRQYVRDEIAGCALWSGSGPAVADELLSRLDKKPMMDHSIIVWFLVSGWYNHSLYLDTVRRRP